eukprot:1161311-Pelagomonas_calceolata.AAC.7
MSETTRVHKKSGPGHKGVQQSMSETTRVHKKSGPGHEGVQQIMREDTRIYMRENSLPFGAWQSRHRLFLFLLKNSGGCSGRIGTELLYCSKGQLWA